MVVCRFFQQGTCKFGQNCRFEHISPQYVGSTISPMLRQSTQPPPNVTAPKVAQANPFRTARKEPATVRDVYNLMQQDLGESEKGSVWPLSCYNFWPAIARGNVPGLEDLCPEEMRHLQLEAQKTGNMDVCNQQIQQLYQQARATINGLKVASQETVSIIETMVRDRAQANASQSPYAAGNSVAQDAWPKAPTQAQNPIFGGSSSTRQAFGGSPASVFSPAVAGQPSGFGGASLGSSQQSIFGGSSASSQQAPSGFGGATQPPAQASFFAGTSAFGSATQMPVFGGATQSTFGGNSQQTSLFAGAATHQATPFAPAPTVSQSAGSIFGGGSAAPPPAASSFSFALGNKFGAAATGGQVATASPFASNSTNVFGGVANQSSAQPGAGIFGGFAQPQASSQNVNIHTPGVALNSTLYTSLAQLTDAEKKEFEAGTFTVGHIPTRPPPKELC